MPRVDGRHRNRALASARRARAVELRTHGWTYQAIATELGYANRGTVHAIVRQALSNQEAENVTSLRDLEVARLDALQASIWAEAMAGDLQAAATVRKIIEARCRVLGLGTAGPKADREPRTLVQR